MVHGWCRRQAIVKVIMLLLRSPVVTWLSLRCYVVIYMVELTLLRCYMVELTLLRCYMVQLTLLRCYMVELTWLRCYMVQLTLLRCYVVTWLSFVMFARSLLIVHFWLQPFSLPLARTEKHRLDLYTSNCKSYC